MVNYFMRIGLCSLFKSSWGGGESHVASLRSALVRDGYSVSNFNAFVSHPNAAGGNGFMKAFFSLSRKAITEDLFYNSEIGYHTLRLHQFAKKEKVNLLHYHYVNFIPSACFLRAIDRIPIVITIHWCPFDYPPELAAKLIHSCTLPAQQYLTFKFGVKNANVVISPSRYYADVIKKRCGVQSIVIPNPISLQKFELLPKRTFARRELGFNYNEFLILVVGRLDSEKGIRYLIEAFSTVVEEYSTTRLLIVGDGPLKDSLMYTVHSMHVPNVVFLGRVPDSVLDLLLSAVDLYVSPSLYENLSISILNALAAGLPIVCTNVGGSSEIIENNINGLLFNPKDTIELSHAISKVISDKSLQKSFRKNNKKKAKQYSEDLIFPKIEKIYADLLS
jgi:glycosyltransferase involved in cell wall biosynthesis